MDHYGQKTAPDYDLSLIQTPLAFFSGYYDQLSVPDDVKWTAAHVNHTLVFEHQYPLGHGSFVVAKDMSYFQVDAMAVINSYNNKTSYEDCYATRNSHC